jgi:hypothetical protein
MFGYNMRALIQVLQVGPEILEADIQRQISRLDTTTLWSLTKLDEDNAGNVSHNLTVRTRPNQHQTNSAGYLLGDVSTDTVASPAVWKNLLLIQGREVYLQFNNNTQFTNMLYLFRGVPEAASSAGWLCESLCHDKIRRRGTLTLRVMAPTAGQTHLAPSDETVSISLKQLAPHIFNPSDLNSFTCDTTKYFMPFSGNNPTFDSFFHHKLAGVGLQMTLKSDHTLNADGLRMLYGRLDSYRKGSCENWFVFVIRKGSVFKCKSLL